MKVEIKLEDQGIQSALNEMLKRTNDLSPAMRGIAAIMESSAEGAFEDEADPTTGTPWAPLSDETTIPFRMKNGHWPGKKLQVEGGLAASIESASGSDFAEIGAGVVYAAIHQFGGTINMPARKTELFFKQNSDGTMAVFIILCHFFILCKKEMTYDTPHFRYGSRHASPA